MTRDEVLAALKSYNDVLQVCRKQKEAVIEKWDTLKDAEVKPLQANLNSLEEQETQLELRCVETADFLPFQARDFITANGCDFYQVAGWTIDYDPNNWLREPNGLSIDCRAWVIRKSGKRAEHWTSLRDYRAYRKVAVSEDLRLRRALKLQLRQRLEGVTSSARRAET